MEVAIGCVPVMVPEKDSCLGLVVGRRLVAYIEKKQKIYSLAGN